MGLEVPVIQKAHPPSGAVARSAVADYIDNFYNTTRRHSSLGDLSPINYEASVRMDRAA